MKMFYEKENIFSCLFALWKIWCKIIFQCLVLHVKTYFYQPSHHSHHHKPSHHQPPHNQLTWKNHNQNQNSLISKSKSNPSTKPTTHHPWNPQIIQATNPPKTTPNWPPSTLELNLTHHHWNPQSPQPPILQNLKTNIFPTNKKIHNNEARSIREEGRTKR